MNTELREKVADLEHQQWCCWENYKEKLFDGKLDDHAFDDIDNQLEKWRELTKTPYKDLTEKQKDSDRVWADKVIKLVLDEVFEKILNGWFKDRRGEPLHCSFCKFGHSSFMNNHYLFKRILCDDCLSKFISMQEELKQSLGGK